MLQQAASCCTVLYGDHSEKIVLPLTPPLDSYVFLKQQLCDRFTELEAGEIQVKLPCAAVRVITIGVLGIVLIRYIAQVHAIGASLPGLWPAQIPLERGTYRVSLKPGPPVSPGLQSVATTVTG